ncbi:MAG: prephenate dehydratase [Vulcanisaeta sp. AZ3]|jgi:prephenate dehydratase
MLKELISNVHEPILIRLFSEYIINDSVGFLGPSGSYSHEVAIRLFGEGKQYLPMRSVEEVVKCVYDNNCGFGVIPIENNLAGVVGDSMDSLIKWDVGIKYSVEYRVNLCLIVNDCVKSMEEITEIYSHPHAISEAMNFITRHGASVIYTQSTSEALERIKGFKNRAAIASRLGAEIHGLKAMVCGIEDRPNYTRFLIISKRIPMVGDRTLIIFSIPNRPGALYNALRPLAERGLNLSMIYSKPNRQSPWGYDFLLEVECQLRDVICTEAIRELNKVTTYLKVLGSYNHVKIT